MLDSLRSAFEPLLLDADMAQTEILQQRDEEKMVNQQSIDLYDLSISLTRGGIGGVSCDPGFPSKNFFK